MAAAVPNKIPPQIPPAVEGGQEFIPGASAAFVSALTSQLFSAPTSDSLTWNQIDLMRLDPVIDAGIELLKDLVLAEGCQIVPAKAPDDQQDSAADIAAFITRAFARISAETFAGLLEAIAYGHAVAESIFEEVTTGEDAGRLQLRALKLKDRGATEFVVDRFWNVLGLKAVGDPKVPLLPRAKFVVLTLRKRGEDPRGRTSLRSQFAPWRFKQEIWPAWLRFLKTCAIPSLIGKPSEKAMPQPKRDASGNPILDRDGKPQMMPPGQALLATLQNMENATVGVVGHGTEIEQIQAQGEGEIFNLGIDAANREMTLGLLRQTRATGEAQYGSKADSETGRSLLSYLVANLRRTLAGALTQDLIHPLVLWNFGPDALALAPTASLGDTDRYDWARDANAAALLADKLTDSQWASLTEMLGIPAPQEGEERPKRAAASMTDQPPQKQQQEEPKQ